MGTTFRFLEDPAAPSSVLTWFRNLEVPPREVKSERGFTLHFQEAGPVNHDADGQVDSKASPLAMVIQPRIRRGVLWTVGEVHFLATPLRERFPGVHKISAAFSKWLAAHECVYSNKRKSNPFSYYLEGSVQNYDPEVFAFESALSALDAGQYFVTEDDTEFRLDAICKMLRLRGVECSDS
jgi:hypothetical protein